MWFLAFLKLDITDCLSSNKCVTFTESVDSSPVGGSAAHVIKAGSSELICGVRLETCAVC